LPTPTIIPLTALRAARARAPWPPLLAFSSALWRFGGVHLLVVCVWYTTGIYSYSYTPHTTVFIRAIYDIPARIAYSTCALLRLAGMGHGMGVAGVGACVLLLLR
jgi:hypothetical protein